MSVNPLWHKASFDRFLHDRLPQLLAERLPLTGYHVAATGPYTCHLDVALVAASGDVELIFPALPQPDADGLFEIDGQLYLVAPTAADENLDTAEIRCTGEQLADYVRERLGQAPPDLAWDAALARAWLPLESWFGDFLRQSTQPLDDTNWLSRHTHLRRILVLNSQAVIAPGQMGRVCPFESPEGANLGRVFTIANGAEIRAGRLVIVDERPEMGLGLSAAMIPCLEHSDPNRLLMGANMMRQWLVPSDPEPALVQTGVEPAAPDFWAGRNLLTAFIAWGGDTFSDGIVLSQSGAQRLSAEVGDKLSNRHGSKGVVSRVLPDAHMPHLPDGTPVELVYSFYGMHARMNFGQVREAVLGRLARAEACDELSRVGQPALTPPFHAPTAAEIRQRLVRAGLPESGMETLTIGQDGPALERASTVGWVYWGRTVHLAREKVRVSVGSETGQMQGELENQILLALGAPENLRESLNTRAVRRPDAHTLAERVAAGPVEQAGPPTPLFAGLVERLNSAGVRATLEDERLVLRFQPPAGDVLTLARPLPHPWLRERELAAVGAYPALDETAVLVEANARLARMLANGAPERLVQSASGQLESRLQAYFDALLTPAHLHFRERQLFSGRAVVAPGPDLRLDQVGLAEDIAWTLFGPLVVRELGDAAAVRERSAQAAKTLDALMGRAWLIVNRAPSLSPTALLAFHPVRDPAAVIRLHPLVCAWLNADFDGDQVAVLLPITAAAQREAGERLSVAAHLARDPGLLEGLLPPYDALWGLASLSRTGQGRQEIDRLAGAEVVAPRGIITQESLGDALRTVLARDGVTATLAALERLTRRGFDIAKASGASLSPFVGQGLARPPKPASDDPGAWDAYVEEWKELLIAATGYERDELGPQLLAVHSRPQRLEQLAWLVGARRPAVDVSGTTVVVRHSLAEGLAPEEMAACVAGARQGLAGFWSRWEQMTAEASERRLPGGMNVLARARRAKRPGIVFARAAASGETDPLTDVESRALVGLSPLG